MIHVELHVAGNKKVESAVVIVVAPGGTGGPAAHGNTGLFRKASESTVMVVVVKAILAEVADVNVGPPVVVIVADGYSKAPALVGNAGVVGHVGKRSIVIV